MVKKGGSMSKRKTWKEKLHDSKDFPRVQPIEEHQEKMWGEGTIVIAKPIEVDEIMKKIPKGKLITINKIREILAEKHGATIACPITTGIFARIAAGAAEEDLQQGKKRITPYWRTLKAGGVVNEKYPGGIQKQIEFLELEGHTVIPKGKSSFRVLNYEKYLV